MNTLSAPTLSLALPMSIPTPKGRVLCVDDEPNILRALSWLLQKEFEVVTAASAREGLELVRGDKFDVVISDQRMPDMSGVDFLKEVRAMEPRAMRILLTGYSDLQAVLRSVNESEIFRYITKPWNVSELPRVVARAAEIARSQPVEFAADCSGGRHEILAGEAKILVLCQNSQVHAMVEFSVGDLATIIHASSIGDAIHALKDRSVGVIVAETRIGSLDLTRLLCLVKERHPRVVSVVLAAEAETEQVAALINRGQIFRLVTMPIKAGELRHTLRSALRRNHRIKARPALARRHEVEALTAEERAGLQLAPVAAPPPLAAPCDLRPPLSRAARMAETLRRLFGLRGEHA